MNKACEAEIVSQSEGGCSIVLFPKGITDHTQSVNALLIQEGYGSLTKNEDEWPSYLDKWEEFETNAKEEHIKIWKHGGPVNDDSD